MSKSIFGYNFGCLPYYGSIFEPASESRTLYTFSGYCDRLHGTRLCLHIWRGGFYIPQVEVIIALKYTYLYRVFGLWLLRDIGHKTAYFKFECHSSYSQNSANSPLSPSMICKPLAKRLVVLAHAVRTQVRIPNRWRSFFDDCSNVTVKILNTTA